VIVEPAIPAEALARIRAPFLDRDAEPVDPPVMQPLEVLLDLTGEAMRSRLYVVQGEGGTELALRPDFTVPVARQHIAAGRVQGRYRYEGRAFRTPPPGSNRPHEFLQLGLEIIGAAASPEADAEIVALAWRAAAAGGRGDLSLVMGDLALFDAFVRALEIPPVLAARIRRSLGAPGALQAALAPASVEAGSSSDLAGLLARQPEAEAADLLEQIWSLAGVEPIGGRTAAEIAHRLAAKAAAPALLPENRELLRRFLAVDDRPAAALDSLAALARDAGVDLDEPLQAAARRLAALERLDVQAEARLAASFGRPFSYYDGLLFEVHSAALGPEQPVAAGGRYDRLTDALGGRAASAVGCMVRPGRAWSGA
jgi:ATP phosphoribosyltransferase regulatory subunit